MSESRVGRRHGVHFDSDGRWIAYCRYHGSCASAPIEDFVRSAWIRHLTRDCVIPTFETRASQLRNAKDELTAYVVPLDLWREIRAALQREHDPAWGAIWPAHPDATASDGDAGGEG